MMPALVHTRGKGEDGGGKGSLVRQDKLRRVTINRREMKEGGGLGAEKREMEDMEAAIGVTEGGDKGRGEPGGNGREGGGKRTTLLILALSKQAIQQ